MAANVFGRMATLLLVGTVVTLSALAVLGAYRTRVSAADVNASAELNNAYERAAGSFVQEESLERKYRLEPGPDVLAKHQQARAGLVAALHDIDAMGTAEDKDLVRSLTAAHNRYVAAINRLFAAVDRADPVEALRIDGEEVDPTYTSMETDVGRAAARHHAAASRSVHNMRTTGQSVFLATAIAFACGLVLLFISGRALVRSHRRLLEESEANARLAVTDALTGLPNRNQFREWTARALAVGDVAAAAPAVIVVDVDHFNDVNDALGYHYGDGLLRQIADRLAANVHTGFRAARLGGDGFAVLLTGTDRAGTTANAKLVRDLLHTPFLVDAITIDLETSMGIARARASDHDADALLQHADNAMHTAKRNRSGCEDYDPALDDKTPARLALLGDLRRAVEADDIDVHYQPKVDARTGRLSGAEALARWSHRTRGRVAPDEFIPLAEGTGLIMPLTRQILNQALARAREWQATGEAIPVSVNVSARCLLDTTFPQTVRTVIAKHQVAAELLILEITEGSLSSDPVKSGLILRELRADGVRLSLDDYGTGYSTMAHLKEIPADELKIDRSLVVDIASDAGSVALVRSAIELGHSLGLSVVAEGVEDERTLATLRLLGCDHVQGYLLGRPMDGQQFESWRATNAAARAWRAEPPPG